MVCALHRLTLWTRVHGVGNGGRHCVDAILARARAESALDRFVAHVRTIMARVLAAESDDRGGALIAGLHPVRHECRHGAEAHVGHPVPHLVIGVHHRRRKLGVYHGALGSGDLDRAPGALGGSGDDPSL